MPSRDDLDAARWRLVSEGLEDAGSARNLKEFCAKAAKAAGMLVPHDVGAACFAFERGLPRWLAGDPERIGVGFNATYRYLIPATDLSMGHGLHVVDFSRRGSEAYISDYLDVVGIKYTLGALDGDFQLCIYRSDPDRAYRSEDMNALRILRIHMAAIYHWISEAERALRRAGAGLDPAGPARLLTRRELEVLACLERDLTAREIGVALDMSPRTAERHIANLYDKLGVGSRAGLFAALARRPGSEGAEPSRGGGPPNGAGSGGRPLLRFPRDEPRR